MLVRLATKLDKVELLKLVDQLSLEILSKDKSANQNPKGAQQYGGPIFDELLRRKDTEIFVAEDKGKLVGVATFYILPNIRHGHRWAHIDDFVVDKSTRCKGIGSALFNYIKKYCKQNDIRVIKLESGYELLPAHEFYEKLGGKSTDRMFRFDIK